MGRQDFKKPNMNGSEFQGANWDKYVLKVPSITENRGYYEYRLSGEKIGGFAVLNFAKREEYSRALKSMKWFNPAEAFRRNERPIPEHKDGLVAYDAERQMLAMWMPVIEYNKRGCTYDFAKEMLETFFQRENMSEIFVQNYKKRLDDLTDILLKYQAHGN